MVDLYTEKLTLPELQRVVARLLEYLEVEVSRRPDDPFPSGLRLVPKEKSP
jgi:hypothetical protein